MLNFSAITPHRERLERLLTIAYSVNYYHLTTLIVIRLCCVFRGNINDSQNEVEAKNQP